MYNVIITATQSADFQQLQELDKYEIDYCSISSQCKYSTSVSSHLRHKCLNGRTSDWKNG